MADILSISLQVSDDGATAKLTGFERKASETASKVNNAGKNINFTRTLNSELDKAESRLQQFGKNFNAGFSTIFGGNLAANAFSKLTSELVSGGKSVLDYSANLEQARVGLTTITGSAEIAGKHLKDLQNFAKTTPFEFSDLVNASQKLQGVGFSAQQVIPVLKDVGSALSASGRISELPFAIKALGDIQAKGKLAGQEIIQLANAGIPAIKVLSGALGKTNAEVLALSESGQISSEVFLNALRQYSESNFGGALEAQSKTFQGAISNIKDALGQTSEVAFRPLFQKVSEIALNLSTEIGKEGKNLQDVGGLIARSVIIGFKDVIKDELTLEIEQIRKNLAEGKPSGISGPAEFGASLVGEGNSLPELFRAARRLSSITSDNDLTVNDIPALKSLNFFGKFDDLITQLEADKQQTFDKLVAAITFKGDDFSPTATSKGNPINLNNLNANKDLFKQLEAQTKFNLSAVDSYLDYSKTQIAADNGTNVLQKITQTLEIEQLAIKEKIRLQKKFAADELKSLTPEERNGAKGAILSLRTVDTINRLEIESEVLRLKAQKQSNEEIEKGKEKVKQLGETYRSVFENLSNKLNSNNPFLNLFSEADKSAKTLRETIKLLSPELQKAALTLEGKLNSNNLFSARLDNKLNVFGLRDEANNFRNPFDGSKQKQEQDEFLERFFRNNPNYAFLNNIPANTLIKDLPEAERTKILTRFGNSALTETPADRLNKRLEEQQNLIFGDFRNRLTPDQQSIADKKFISLTSGVNPLELSNANREAAAIVREREALRQEQNEQKARQQRDALIETNKQIAENGKKLLAIAEKEGLQGIEKLLKVEITDNSNGRAKITDRAATPQSVEQLYNQDTENSFQFNR